MNDFSKVKVQTCIFEIDRNKLDVYCNYYSIYTFFINISSQIIITRRQFKQQLT